MTIRNATNRTNRTTGGASPAPMANTSFLTLQISGSGYGNREARLPQPSVTQFPNGILVCDSASTAG